MDVEQLYTRYGPMVIRRCRHLLRDEEEALDVAQDVFVQVLRKGDRLSDQYPSSLLYRIATNLSLNRIRDRDRAPSATEQELLEQIACSDVDERRLGARRVLDHARVRAAVGRTLSVVRRPLPRSAGCRWR